jgi:fucose 4-O-acetylase-like acetyltransferase
MIFDFIVGLIAIGALINGYKNGLLTTIFRAVFFIAGGVGAMYLVIKYNQNGWLILAIIIGAYAAAWVGTQIAKTLKLTIIRGPLRVIDSILGAVLEVGKYVILFYIIGTILLWAPWIPGQNAVSESKFYLQVDKHAPGVISDIRRNVEKALANPRL